MLVYLRTEKEGFGLKLLEGSSWKMCRKNTGVQTKGCLTAYGVLLINAGRLISSPQKLVANGENGG